MSSAIFLSRSACDGRNCSERSDDAPERDAIKICRAIATPNPFRPISYARPRSVASCPQKTGELHSAAPHFWRYPFDPLRNGHYNRACSGSPLRYCRCSVFRGLAHGSPGWQNAVIALMVSAQWNRTVGGCGARLGSSNVMYESSPKRADGSSENLEGALHTA
jgi:hypothetical protein